MKYLLLIYGQSAEDAFEVGDPAAWGTFNQMLEERGAARGSEALTRASSARTVSVSDGTPLVTDGPFAETKEQLAGYYLVDCPGWDEALEIAAQIPSAADGSARIEVRAVLAWEEQG